MKKATVVIVCWVGLILSLQPAAAANSSPVTKAAVILCSDEVPSAEVVKKFLGLAGGRARAVTLLNLAPARPELTARVREAFEKFDPAVKVVVVNWRGDVARTELAAVENTRAAWVSGDGPPSLPPLARADELKRLLGRLQARGGIIGAGGAAAALLAETNFVERQAAAPAGGGQTFRSVNSIRQGLLENVEGLGAVRGLVVDRNSIKGSRLNHLVNIALQHPRLTVLGMDEHGAVWVKPDGDVEVIGAANVLIISAAHARIAPARAGQRAAEQHAYLSAEGVRLHLLLPGGSYNVPARVVKATGVEAARGHLMLIGGGAGFPPDALDKFVELIGGPEQLILVFSLGLDDKERQRQEFEAIKELFTKKGCKNVQPVFAETAKDLEKVEAVALVARARGVVFGGGDQRRITRVLQGTPVERALWEIYSTGAVIAGSSAGTAIQGQLMITGDGKSLADDKSLPSPFHTIRVGNVELTPGMGFFPRAIIDQHFIARARGNRLFSAVLEHPDLMGVGIDAGAAVWLKPDRTFQVMGNSSVMIINAAGARVGLGETIAGVAGARAVAAGDLSVALLSPGDSYDLGAQRIIRPAALRAKRAADRGRPRARPITPARGAGAVARNRAP